MTCAAGYQHWSDMYSVRSVWIHYLPTSSAHSPALDIFVSPWLFLLNNPFCRLCKMTNAISPSPEPWLDSSPGRSAACFCLSQDRWDINLQSLRACKREFLPWILVDNCWLRKPDYCKIPCKVAILKLRDLVLCVVLNRCSGQLPMETGHRTWLPI